MSAAAHPDFGPLSEGWELAIRADGYSPNTLDTYRQALARFALWLGDAAPGAAPDEVTRDHVRGWVVNLRETVAPNSARAWFGGVRHFYRWMVAEGECLTSPFQDVRTPAAGQPHTPVLTNEDIRRLLGACSGPDFAGRRDTAILMILADGGLRLSELSELLIADVDIRDRVIFVIGKGSNRSGPRRRAVPLGIKAARTLERYMRERRRHPYAHLPKLWLGAKNGATLTANGIEAMLRRRGDKVGVKVHPHMFRHTWASAFRMAGGEEGDLMVLGGWRSRQMLDRYGKAAAVERAQAAYRPRSLGDRL